ncbi:hypothetical protein [Leucothrix pacifica]|uniref:Uncharacterized protein n=1 Tax=Leucothrix pacifica TaxID=1247513 RepID=A0A317CJM0_9GAMM|nr:hypothetical protein [Leucothrix pacifica]PWQ97633.1 hypothetical protein DKW60_09640 [Leucothrix pacifica]
MNKKIAMTVLSASALLFTYQASAHNTSSEIDKQQHEQAVMIAQGMKTCQLTPEEAKSLKAMQSSIAALEKKYRYGGLQSWELNTLASKLHNARVEINKLTKNSTTCNGRVTDRDLQPGVIGRSDASRISRTMEGRGTENVVIGR